MLRSCDVIERKGEAAVAVVFACDNDFFINLVVCIRSLLQNASEGNVYDLVVLTNDLSPGNEGMLQQMVQGRANVSLRVYDVSHLSEKYALESLETGRRLTVTTYYRFFIPELMPDYDKVLYLDGDTVVMEDMAEVFKNDISQYYAAAVRDYNIIRDMSPSFSRYVGEVLGMADRSRYFNAGVLLLNLALIRRDFSTAYLCRSAETRGRKHHDQDVLNSLFYGRVLYLGARYNVFWLNRAFYFDLPDADQIIRHPAIIHYAGGMKPYRKNGAFRREASFYWKYAAETPYYPEIKKYFLKDCREAVLDEARDRKELLRCRLMSLVCLGKRRRHYREKIIGIKRSLETTREIRSGKIPEWVI